MFSPEEDSTLKSLVLQSIEPDWKAIASQMGNRTPRQCRERYKNYLSPDLSTRPWSETEDAILTEKVHEIGKKWAQISQFFEGRSDVSLKNRWTAINMRGSAHHEAKSSMKWIDEPESPGSKSNIAFDSLMRKSAPPPIPPDPGPVAPVEVGTGPVEVATGPVAPVADRSGQVEGATGPVGPGQGSEQSGFNIDEISWNSIGSAAQLKTELNWEPNALKDTFPNYGGRFW